MSKWHLNNWMQFTKLNDCKLQWIFQEIINLWIIFERISTKTPYKSKINVECNFILVWMRLNQWNGQMWFNEKLTSERTMVMKSTSCQQTNYFSIQCFVLVYWINANLNVFKFIPIELIASYALVQIYRKKKSMYNLRFSMLHLTF